MDSPKPTSTMPHRTTAGVPRSPRLIRSSSGSLPEIRAPSPARKSINRTARSATTSPRPSIDRSRSIMRPRSSGGSSSNAKDQDDKVAVNFNRISSSRISSGSPRMTLHLTSSNSENGGDNRVLRKPSPQNVALKRMKSLASPPPSAWALSPRRPLHCPPVPAPPESPTPKVVVGGGVGGGVSKVLRYFSKEKKASPVQEEELHRYRVVYNRYLQWRFANAKAEAAMATVKTKVEGKLFGVWLQIYKMRYSVAEKGIKVQRLKQKIKLLDIVCPQIELLNEWEKIEKRNCEAVGRVTRKLSALSTKLPLIQGAQVDVISLYESMRLAIEVMEDIEDTIIKFHLQAEEICYCLRELHFVLGKQHEFFQELEEVIDIIVALEGHEQSLRAYVMQSSQEQMEKMESQSNCKYHLIHSFGNKKINLLRSVLNVS